VKREEQPGTASASPVGSSQSALARRKRLRQIGIPYLFLLPFLILFALFLVLPLAYAFWISIFEERLVGGTVFVGADNYLHALRDGAFWNSVRRMVTLGVFQIPVMLGLALVFALILDSGLVWFRSAFRLGFFLPYAVPGVVAVLIWGYLYGPTFGPFTQLANYLGVPPPNFLSESSMLASIANIITWEFVGYNMIIMYAALQAIPTELHDAGAVDGARVWQIALYIKIPLIVPAVLLTCIFSIIGTLQLFQEPAILQSLARGVIVQSYTPNLYVYGLAFTNQEYNYSAAVSFLLGAVVVVGSYAFMLATNRGRISRR
jgi:multiple sugar transport system permease protein